MVLKVDASMVKNGLSKADGASQLGLVYFADYTTGMTIPNDAMRDKLAIWHNGKFYSVGTDTGFTSQNFDSDLSAGRFVDSSLLSIDKYLTINGYLSISYSTSVGSTLSKCDCVVIAGNPYPLHKKATGVTTEINLVSQTPYLKIGEETYWLKDIAFESNDIRSWWAKGVGESHDDTASFTNAFEAAKGADNTGVGRSVFNIYIPNPIAFYKITDTIDLQGIYGLYVHGDGALTQRSGSPNPCEEAAIRWYGTESKPIFGFTGDTQTVSNPNFYIVFQNITLTGYKTNLLRDGSILPSDLALAACMLGNYAGSGEKTLNRQVKFENCVFSNFRFGSGSTDLGVFNTDHARITYDNCYWRNNAQAGLIWGSGNAIVTLINPFFEGNGWGASQFPADEYSPQIGANTFVRSGTCDIYSYTSTGKGDNKPTDADIYQTFGQVNVNNAWSDTHGYFLYQVGGGTSFAGVISGVRHFEASMDVTNTPDSVRVTTGGTTVNSCSLYGNLKLDSGNSNRPVCNGITFLRASATFTGSAVQDQRTLIHHGNAGNAAQSLWGGADEGVELRELGVLVPQHLHMGVHTAGSSQLYAVSQVRGAKDTDASYTVFFDAATGAEVKIINGYLSSTAPFTITPTRVGNVYYITEGQGEVATMRQAYSSNGVTPIPLSSFNVTFDIRSGAGVYGNQVAIVPPLATTDPTYDSAGNYWEGAIYFNTTTKKHRTHNGIGWVDL